MIRLQIKGKPIASAVRGLMLIAYPSDKPEIRACVKELDENMRE
jgi:hypothetical protein